MCETSRCIYVESPDVRWTLKATSVFTYIPNFPTTWADPAQYPHTTGHGNVPTDQVYGKY